jgi:1A family penicillin-binding protein
MLKKIHHTLNGKSNAREGQSVSNVKNSHHAKRKKTSFGTKMFKELTYFTFGLGFILGAVFLVWFATLKLPDFNDFENRKIANSTKIYDRTGKVLLYNLHDNIKRTQIKGTEISDNIKKATIAIEDRDFYNHIGISPRGILRSVWVALTSGSASQGGSTITQQVIKNSLLTREKTISRKIKEWVLAIKLDAQVSKEDILTIYLNESPYGGTIYGVEEASLSYYNKNAKDVTLAEAAYLAAMPQAPSRYSPFSGNKEALENRKNLVLDKMLETGIITAEELAAAKLEKVAFQDRNDSNGKAYHFVFYVIDYLEQKYGKEVIENEGLKVITTLNWDYQKEGEVIVKEAALKNAAKFGAENAAMVTLDPKTGQILAMVGSRDYFDEKIDGKYNIATALRQPGSTFKPIVYLLSFMKGFEPETVLYDVPTQFSTNCDAYGTSLNGGKCYAPVNYDGNFHGPVSLRIALQNSINIPAVKLLYLVGVKNTLDFAKKLGITSLGDTSRFGLSLVLGGGEVSLLEMTNVYSTFANSGVYNKTTPILEIKDKNGEILEKYVQKSIDVVPKEYTDKLSNVLSDPEARSLTFSRGNPINFYDRQVAAKTGTTNDFRDVWVMGYTPSIAVGTWGGNNDNRSVGNIAGAVLSPMWRKYMNFVLKDLPVETFDAPVSDATSTPSWLNGNYCANGAGTILRFIGGSGSKGGPSDPQYNLWNAPILAGGYCNNGDTGPKQGDEGETPGSTIDNTTGNTVINNGGNIIDITPTPAN